MKEDLKLNGPECYTPRSHLAFMWQYCSGVATGSAIHLCGNNGIAERREVLETSEGEVEGDRQRQAMGSRD
jgi:hypothetical protein